MYMHVHCPVLSGSESRMLCLHVHCMRACYNTEIIQYPPQECLYWQHRCLGFRVQGLGLRIQATARVSLQVAPVFSVCVVAIDCALTTSLSSSSSAGGATSSPVCVLSVCVYTYMYVYTEMQMQITMQIQMYVCRRRNIITTSADLKTHLRRRRR